MSKITIKSLENFLIFLSTISKIVPAVKFNIDQNKTIVNAQNESKTIRLNGETDCMVSDKPMSFAFNDIIKLHNTFSIIKDVDTNPDIKLDFNGTFISYKGLTKFKLKCVKEDIMIMYISSPLKTTLENIFTFEINPTDYKSSLKMGNILSGCDDIKIYLIQENDRILAEFDDKSNKFSDSVTYPLSNKVTGNIDKPIIVSQDVYRIFGVIPSSNVEVNLTNKNVLQVNTKREDEKSYIDLNIICSILKG